MNTFIGRSDKKDGGSGATDRRTGPPPWPETILNKPSVDAGRKAEYKVLVIGKEDKRFAIVGNVGMMGHATLESDSLQAAIRIAVRERPNVIVIDGDAVERNNLSQMRYLKRGAPAAKILVLDAEQAGKSCRTEILKNGGADRVFEEAPQIDTFDAAIAELMPVRFVPGRE